MALAQQADPSASYASAALALPDSEALAARLREIVAQSALPIEALDPALHAVLEATGAGAGAVCVYDQRRQLLRLAAEAGLSDEGCRRLRTIRRGDGVSWDMPLQGLLNRRAYLIESAAQNRYVPALADGIGAVRAVACLPMYAGAIPVGSLVLVMLGGRALRERDVQALDRPLRELAKLIESVRRHAAEGSAAPPSRDPATPEGTAELDRLRTQIVDAEARAAHAEQARAELQVALERETSANRADLQQALDTGRRTEATRAALAAENAELAAQLERARHEIERTRPMIAALATTEQERVRLTAALEALTVEHAESARARMAEDAARAAESERAGSRLAETLAATKHELARTRGKLEELRQQAATLRTERASLSHTIDEACARQHDLEARLAEREAAAERARVAHTEEVAGLSARLDALTADADGLRGEIAALVGERDRLVAEVEGGVAARGRLEEALEEAHRQTEAAAQELVTAVEVLEEAQPADLEEDVPGEVEVPVTLAATGDASDPDVAVVVLDGHGAWTRAAERVVVVAPDDQAPARLAGMSSASVLANLAVPGAMSVLATLRAAGSRAPFWGCLAEPARDRGLALGRIEPACRPLDPGALTAALRRASAPRAARVVTVGDDVEAFVSLRQALTRDGMSVSMAWNAKQAADLFPMVRPAVVVLDLDLPGADTAGALALVAATSTVVLTVLVAGRRDPAATLAGVPPELANPRLGSLVTVLDRSLPQADGGR